MVRSRETLGTSLAPCPESSCHRRYTETSPIRILLCCAAVVHRVKIVGTLFFFFGFARLFVGLAVHLRGANQHELSLLLGPLHRLAHIAVAGINFIRWPA